MNEERQFEQQWLAEPPRYDKFHTDCYLAAEDYEKSTDRFDEMVCTARRHDGVAMPASAREYGMINEFAQNYMRRMIFWVASEHKDKSEAEIRKAIRGHLFQVRHLESARRGRRGLVQEK